MIGDIFKLSVICNNIADGSDYVNVHHFRQETPLVDLDPGTDLVNAWEATIPALYTPLMSNITALTQAEVRQIGLPTYIYARTLTGYVGDNTDNMLPPTTAPLISWRTGLAGRSYRGRTYMFPTTEVHQERGVVAASYSGAWEDWANAMLTIGDGVTSAQYILTIYSPTLNDDTPVQSFLLRGILARMKNRQIGEGS